MSQGLFLHHLDASLGANDLVKVRGRQPSPASNLKEKTVKYLLALVLVGCCAVRSAWGQETKSLRAGIIGLDTSHVVAFTRVLNNPNNAGDLAGVRVVAAFTGGSPDVASSRDRVAGYTKQLRDEFKVEIVSSIGELLSKVDVVLLESVDGRPHLTQATPVLKSGKPIFIDKPIAGSLADALAIFDLADKYKTPVFSSSSLRYYPGIAGVKRNAKVGAVMGCLAYGPCSLEEHHPDLFWYGIHGVESLFTIMGTGCQTVSRAHSADADVVTGIWADGRIGTFRGIRRGSSGYDALVFGSKGIALAGGQGDYEPLVKEIARFLKTGIAPVSSNETIEIYTFMEAADESKRQGGKPVAMESVLQKARAINAKKRLGGMLGANTWDRFRGPNGTGTVIDKDVPVTFNSKENVVWKVACRVMAIPAPLSGATISSCSRPARMAVGGRSHAWTPPAARHCGKGAFPARLSAFAPTVPPPPPRRRPMARRCTSRSGMARTFISRLMTFRAKSFGATIWGCSTASMARGLADSIQGPGDSRQRYGQGRFRFQSAECPAVHSAGIQQADW